MWYILCHWSQHLPMRSCGHRVSTISLERWRYWFNLRISQEKVWKSLIEVTSERLIILFWTFPSHDLCILTNSGLSIWIHASFRYVQFYHSNWHQLYRVWRQRLCHQHLNRATLYIFDRFRLNENGVTFHSISLSSWTWDFRRSESVSACYENKISIKISKEIKTFQEFWWKFPFIEKKYLIAFWDKYCLVISALRRPRTNSARGQRWPYRSLMELSFR